MPVHDAIYTRQSVDKKDSISIESQIELCKAETADRPFEVYTDRGFSGKNTKRPEFTHLMKDVEDGRVSRVICYRLDRISRSITDFGAIWDTLSSHNVEFVSVNEKFDTSTPVGRAMLYIIMVFAQLERETIAERVKDNYYLRVKRGAWPGGPAPYGFDVKTEKGTGCRLAPNEFSKYIDDIFSMYAAPGASLGSVSRTLNEKNVERSEKRAAWDSVALARLLHNPAYVKADASIFAYYKSRGVTLANDIDEFNGINGCIIVGRRNANDRKYTDVSNHVLVISNHEGIVSPSVFLQCQSKLESNQQIKNTGKGKYTWLLGLLKFGECGYSLKVLNDKARDTIYLVCSGKVNLGVCTARHSEKISYIEEEVRRNLLERIETMALEKPKHQDADIDKLKSQASVCEEKIYNLISRLSEASSVTMKYINDEVERLSREKDELIRKLSDASASGSPYDIRHVAGFDAMSFEDKKIFAHSMIEKIRCTTDKVVVEWKV